MELERTREKMPVRPKEPEPRPTEKTTPSPFDKVLAESRQLQQSPAAVRQPGRPTHEETEREARRTPSTDRRRDWRAHRERKASAAPRETTHEEEQATAPRHRIVIKVGGRREQGGGAGGGSAEHHGGGGRGGERKATVIKQGLAESRGMPQQGPMPAMQGTSSGVLRVPTQFTPQQLQRLVNQLVHFLRLGRTAVGAEEIQIGLQPQIFHGLRLRLSSQHGKITVQFESSHPSVIRLFERAVPGIAQQLVAKGVAVAGVRVVRTA